MKLISETEHARLAQWTYGPFQKSVPDPGYPVAG